MYPPIIVLANRKPNSAQMPFLEFQWPVLVLLPLKRCYSLQSEFLISGNPTLRTHCRTRRIQGTLCPPRPSLQCLERWLPRRRSSRLSRIHDLPYRGQILHRSLPTGSRNLSTLEISCQEEVWYFCWQCR